MLPLRLPLASLTLALLVQAACTYVPRDRLEEHIDCLDLDGDGAPQGVCTDPQYLTYNVAVDCNDDPDLRGADETPGGIEVPYDGLDNDCSETLDGEADRLDADGDDYPGVSRAAWEALGTRLSGAWPTDLLGDANTVDCNDDPNDPRAAQIYPKPIAQEVWYDGVDENCDGLDDFDADQDGFVATIHEATYATFADAPWHHALPGGDCDDVNADVNPSFNAEDDLPYDGIDKDCDGRNDFDADQDGFVPSTVEVNGQPISGVVARCEAFNIKYSLAVACVPDDCDDDPTTGASVHPGAAEVWYDGLDQDCDGQDDFDADADGFIPPAQTSAYSAHLDAPWHGGLPAGDCDDTDAAVRPGEDERFGDDVDQDCDGGVDTTPFVFANYLVDRPLPPVIAGNDHHYVLGVAASGWGLASAPTSVATNVGLAILFARETVGHGALPTSDTRRWDSQQPVQAFDLIAGGDRYAVGHVEDRETQRRLTTADLRLNTAAGSYTGSALPSLFALAQPVHAFDLARDATGVLWAYACGPDSAQFVASNPTLPSPLLGRAQALAIGGQACWLDLTEQGAFGSGWSPSAPAGTRSYRLLTTPEAELQAAPAQWDLDPALRVSTRGNTYAFAQGTQGLLVSDGTIERRHLTATSTASSRAYDVRSADAIVHGGRLFVLAVVADVSGDGVEDVVFASGPLVGPLQDALVPFAHPRQPQRPAHPSLTVDDEWIALAVSGLRRDPGTTGAADSVGWAFVQMP